MDEFHTLGSFSSHASSSIPKSLPKSRALAPKSKPTLSPKFKTTTKHYSTSTSHQRGHWTDEEHLKYLLACNMCGNDLNEIVKILKTRTKAQICSHKQKTEAAMSKPNFHKLQEGAGAFLKEKLNQAFHQLQYKQIPSLIPIEPNLLQDFKHILGSKINSNFVITKKDIEYVGIVLLINEFDRLFESKPNETKNLVMSSSCIDGKKDEKMLDVEAEDSNENGLLDKEIEAESSEMEVDSFIKSIQNSSSISPGPSESYCC
jgi:hypothetical protein